MGYMLAAREGTHGADRATFAASSTKGAMVSTSTRTRTRGVSLSLYYSTSTASAEEEEVQSMKCFGPFGLCCVFFTLPLPARRRVQSYQLTMRGS